MNKWILLDVVVVVGYFVWSKYGSAIKSTVIKGA
jgi:hypothetical protein